MAVFGHHFSSFPILKCVLQQITVLKDSKIKFFVATPLKVKLPMLGRITYLLENDTALKRGVQTATLLHWKQTK